MFSVQCLPIYDSAGWIQSWRLLATRSLLNRFSFNAKSTRLIFAAERNESFVSNSLANDINTNSKSASIPMKIAGAIPVCTRFVIQINCWSSSGYPHWLVASKFDWCIGFDGLTQVANECRWYWVYIQYIVQIQTYKNGSIITGNRGHLIARNDHEKRGGGEGEEMNPISKCKKEERGNCFQDFFFCFHNQRDGTI